MSKRSANAAYVEEKPEDDRVRLSDVMFVEFVEMNLAEVQADTARMVKKLEELKDMRKQMAEEQNRCLQVAGLPIFEDGMNLSPQLKEMEAKTDGMLHQFQRLMDAKVSLDEAYAKHCKHAKAVVELQMKINYDDHTNKSDQEVKELAAKMEKEMEGIMAEKAVAKAKLTQKHKEYNEVHSSVMKDLAALSQVEQEATEQLEQLKLEEALLNDAASDLD